MLVRNALCRLAADVSKTSTHDLTRIVRPALSSRNGSMLPAVRALARAYAFSLESRRSYATAGATEPTATVKKAVKKAAAKKTTPKKTTATKKTVTSTKKKPAAKKKKPVANKAAPKKKAKKVLTPEKQQELKVKELRRKALLDAPSRNSISAANIFVGQELVSSKRPNGPNGNPALPEVQAKWRSMTAAEREVSNLQADCSNSSRST